MKKKILNTAIKKNSIMSSTQNCYSNTDYTHDTSDNTTDYITSDSYNTTTYDEPTFSNTNGAQVSSSFNDDAVSSVDDALF